MAFPCCLFSSGATAGVQISWLKQHLLGYWGHFYFLSRWCLSMTAFHFLLGSLCWLCSSPIWVAHAFFTSQPQGSRSVKCCAVDVIERFKKTFTASPDPVKCLASVFLTCFGSGQQRQSGSQSSRIRGEAEPDFCHLTSAGSQRWSGHCQDSQDKYCKKMWPFLPQTRAEVVPWNSWWGQTQV